MSRATPVDATPTALHNTITQNMTLPNILAEFGKAKVIVTRGAASARAGKGSAASILTASIETDHFRKDQPQYGRSFSVTFTTPTNSTILLTKATRFALDKIYRPGYAYKRAWVMLSGLVDQGAVLSTLFDGIDHEKHSRLMAALDAVNARFGRNAVRTAAQTAGGVAKMTHQGALSAGFTTRWGEMLRMEVGNGAGWPGGIWEHRRG